VTTLPRAAAALLLAALLPGLPACAPDSATKGENAAGEAAAGLTVSNPRVVLAPVGGNPAAVYFDLSYSGAPGVTLDSVTVDGAGMTMIHDYAESAGTMQMTMADPVRLAEGAPVSFAPGGLHVMAMEPTDALQPGGTARVTFVLSDGTRTSIDAPVRAAGEER
jgi:hypothetical protein